MKNKSIGSLILLALLAPSCGSGGGGGGGSKHPITPPRWEEVNRRPTSADLRAVRFGNPNNGIVAGKFGTFVRTDNGGDTWYSLESTPVQPGNFDILAMAVSNVTTFAVGGSPANGVPPGSTTYSDCMAWQSLDATTFGQPDSPQAHTGAPWVDLVLTGAATSTLAASTLRLESNGVLDLCQGGILGSKDSKIGDPGGTPPIPNAPWTAATGVAIGTSSLWFVCGDNGGFGQIRFTQNANLQVGTIWDTATLPSATTPILRRIGMASISQGFAVGDGGTVLTIDQTVTPAGQAWKNLNAKPGGLTQNLHALHFLDTSTGWVAGDGGTIYRITNASTATPTWLLQTTGTGEHLYDISFVDPDHGFAVGNNGIVLKTTNGTATTPTWTIKTGPIASPQPIFSAVDFSASTSIGLAVGDGGTLVRSLDGGTTWSSFNTGLGVANLTAVSIPRLGSASVAFVGTDTGALFYNKDIAGTGTWLSGGTLGGGVKAILFPKDDSAGIAVGVGGRVALLGYTTLGGVTVTSQAATGNTIFAAACDPTGNTLYVGGDAGYLVKSTNGGAIWTPVAGAPSGSIRTLQAPTGPSFTLFAGVDDDIVHSLSSTGTWAAVAVPGFGTPASMAFINDMYGWVLSQGANAGIRFTIDGGVNWFISVPHVLVDASAAHSLNAIWMHSSGGFGVIVGGNGVIMKTSTGGR